MASRLDYSWHLRLRMAEQGMFNSPELAAALRERGVTLSDSQVWRLVTGTPERLNLRVLVALCDILGCSPSDLIEPVELTRRASRAARVGRSTPMSCPSRLGSRSVAKVVDRHGVRRCGVCGELRAIKKRADGDQPDQCRAVLGGEPA